MTGGEGVLLDVVVLLGAAVVFVPLSQRLGLGSVLGYLLAGTVLGPGGLRIVTATESVQHVSEFGVVFLLFIIGLELEPKRLWDWKVSIFAMGSLQVTGVAGAVAGLAILFGLAWPTAVVLGLACAMSSTAIATQLLRDRNLFRTPGGSSAFSILLFQDIAVVPILSALPWLAGREAEKGSAPIWLIFSVIGVVILTGHFLLRHVLRLVAGAHLREVFTAFSLLLVVGLAVLMQELGVSMALGAFLGGLLLATSEYRHAIENDIEPFKGILLGLFFMSVGMSVDLPSLATAPIQVAGLVVGVVALKLLIHALLARTFRVSRKETPIFSLLLSQVGEFAFVILALSLTLGLVSVEQGARMSAVVALSMATTPLLLLAYDRWMAPWLATSKQVSEEPIHNDDPEVIIAGFGRVGQIVGRLLYANRIRATVLDHDPDQIEFVRQFGFKVYYGDATRLDLLEAAGARNASVLVIAVDDMDDSIEIVDVAKEHFPHLQIVARARNVAHVYELIDRDVHLWERETFDSSMRMGTEVLKVLGWEPYAAVRASAKFRDHNIQLIHKLHSLRSDQNELVSAVKQSRVDLEQMFASEKETLRRRPDAWEIHPKGR